MADCLSQFREDGRRFAVLDIRVRGQIYTLKGAYLLIKEHWRLVVRRFMDRQLFGDPC